MSQGVANAQMRAHLPSPVITRLLLWWHRQRGVRTEPTAVIFPGAKLLRYPRNIQLGADVVVKAGAHLCPCRADAKVSVGDRTTIGFHTFIYASEAITIGEDCMIAPFVYIVDSDHGVAAGSRMNRQSNIARPVVIGDDVWVGAQAIILAGSLIGDGAVVAAGSVVNGVVAPGTIVGGVPARELSKRK